MNVRIEQFSIPHAAALGGDLNQAIVNQISGPAYTLMTDEKKPSILACGGLRMNGIGQAWAMFDQRALVEHGILLARKARLVLDTCIAEERAYRVYAESSEGVDKKWFEHLGFTNSERLFVR